MRLFARASLLQRTSQRILQRAVFSLFFLISLFSFLALFTVPVLATEQCCLYRATGECRPEASYLDHSAFVAACTTANDAVVNACDAGGCRTVCCCATGAAGANWELINQDIDQLKMSQHACNLGAIQTPATRVSKIFTTDAACLSSCAPPPSTTTTKKYTVKGTARLTLTTMSGTTPVTTTGNVPDGSQVSVTVGGVTIKTTTAAGAYQLLDVPQASGVSVLVVPKDLARCAKSDGPFAITGDVTRPAYTITCGQGATCATPAPALATTIKGTSVEMAVTAQNPCGTLQGFSILRCEASGTTKDCAPTLPVGSALYSGSGATVTVDNLASGKTYCFTAKAYAGTSTATSAKKCITMGSTECDGRMPGEEFCGTTPTPTGPVSAVLSCDAEGKLLTPTSDKICTGTKACMALSSGVRCIDSPCVACNGLLGLFASHDLTTSTGVKCEVFTTAPGPLACTLARITDGAPRLFSAYDACSNIKTCDAYTNAASCGADRCGIDDDGCQWKPVSEELGLGVCVPKEGPSPCERCDDLFGGCTASMCRAIGSATDGCYPDIAENGNPSLVQGCVSKTRMSCRYYDTKTDCEGTSPKAAKFDVQYTDTKRSGGTHARTTTSNDLLGIGSCRWVEDSAQVDAHCIKDGDNYPANAIEDDCIDETGTPIDGTCLGDNAPPTTVIALLDATYSVSVLPELPLGAIDDVVTGTKLKTYACINITGATCYPDKTLPNIQRPTPAQLPEGETRAYRLRYYSDDGHGNLEPIAETTLRVKGDGIPFLEDVTVEETPE
jgi:hypothetical protein